MDTYISGEVPLPKGDEAKVLHKNNLVKAKKIIVDSNIDHLIPQVSYLNTPKEMFDSLTNLFEGKNINHKLNLKKIVEECEDLECRDQTVILYMGLSNQRKNCSGRRRSGE